MGVDGGQRHMHDGKRRTLQMARGHEVVNEITSEEL